MNAFDYIIIVAVAAVFIFSLVRIIRKKGGCSCGCSGCKKSCSSCGADKTDKK